MTGAIFTKFGRAPTTWTTSSSMTPILIPVRTARYARTGSLCPGLLGAAAGAAGLPAPMNVGIVGLGYVGLPLAVAFCEAGHDVVGVDVDAAQDRGAQRRRRATSRTSRRALEAVPDRLLADHALRGAVPLRRRDHRVPTPLTRNREPDLGPLLGRGRRVARRAPARPARRARVHDLPRHHPRAPRAAARGVGPGRGQRLQPRLLARARRPGPHRLHACAPRRRSSAASRARASSAPRRSTARSATRSSASPRPRSPSSRSCSRTSSAR